jgi:2,4-dienoyl-CoA reductase-like NADH-dependent reductase (Old Yellow Enzyme family)/thioredoxin reductase
MFEALKSSIDLGGMTLRNRMAMSAMGVEIAEEDGHAGEPIIAYYEERARGGIGLIVTEVCAVAYPHGATALRQLALSSDDYLPGLRELTERVHRHGAKIALQLVHHGKVSRVDMRAGRPLLVPSIPQFKGAMDLMNDLSAEEVGWLMKAVAGPPPTFKEADAKDIEWIIESFANAADRARQAGFDAIEIHGAHGYLLSEFLSPAWNFREDEYGGSPENRARLLCEVIRAIRDRVGPDFPIWPRLDWREFRTPGGITLENAQRSAELAAQAGADAIHVSAYADPTSGVAFTDAPLVHKEAGYVEAAAAIKARIDIPVIAVGRIEPELGDRLIRQGKIDIVAMARKLLADPELPNKIEADRAADIRPCIYCYTCVAQPFFDRAVRCAVNPILGNEAALASAERERAATPKRILIVGAGPSGLEAARLAALRGHEVIVCDKSDQVGGTLRFAALVYEPNERLLDWLERQVRALGVDLRLGREVTVDLVREISPDAVFVATGAKRSTPEIPGVDQDHVFDGDDLRDLLTGSSSQAGDSSATKKLSLAGRLAIRAGRATGITGSPRQLRQASKLFMPIGSRVVILGGGLVGLELAEFLVERGRNITILEEGLKFGLEMAHPRRWRVLHELREKGASLVANAIVHAIEEKEVVYEVASTKGEPEKLRAPADTVLIATGLESNGEATKRLRDAGVPIREIGDVCGPGYLEGAIHDGFRAAFEL